jgi:hypothetical protein
MELKRYQKKLKNEDLKVSSVTLTKKQRDFIDLNNINLSKLIRDLLDKFIKNQDQEKP